MPASCKLVRLYKIITCREVRNNGHVGYKFDSKYDKRANNRDKQVGEIQTTSALFGPEAEEVVYPRQRYVDKRPNPNDHPYN